MQCFASNHARLHLSIHGTYYSPELILAKKTLDNLRRNLGHSKQTNTSNERELIAEWNDVIENTF